MFQVYCLVLFDSEVMSHPVVTLNMREKVGDIVKVLSKEGHHGFPVVSKGTQVRYIIPIFISGPL